MSRPIELALVVASRFGLLLGLALWVGIGAAALLIGPVVSRALEPAPAGVALRAIGRRVDGALFGALVLVVVALGARVALDRIAPPGALLATLGGMALVRVLATLARERPGAAMLLRTLEVCLALYALFAIS